MFWSGFDCTLIVAGRVLGLDSGVSLSPPKVGKVLEKLVLSSCFGCEDSSLVSGFGSNGSDPSGPSRGLIFIL